MDTRDSLSSLGGLSFAPRQDARIGLVAGWWTGRRRAPVRFSRSASGQPQWYTVCDGAREYVDRLSRSFAPKIRVGNGAVEVTRGDGHVSVLDSSGQRETYDHVLFASHGDETLRLLADASQQECAALGAFRYQKNIAVLNRDPRAMLRSKRCWTSWNYTSDGDIDDPAFDYGAIAAQPRIEAIQGVNNSWFCGANLHHGFHEDGLASAVHVAGLLGAQVPWRPIPRLNRRLRGRDPAAFRAWPSRARKPPDFPRCLAVTRYNDRSVPGALRPPSVVRTQR